MSDLAQISEQKRAARIAGVAYLLIFIGGIFAEVFVRDRLVVSDDAATTAANIIANEGLFRIGLAVDMMVFALDVLVAWAFYVLLRPVQEGLALLSTFFRLVMAAMLGLNLLHQYAALYALNGADHLSAFEPAQLESLSLFAMRVHGMGYNAGLVFFGFAIIALGAALFRARYVPRILSVGLALSGVVYLLTSFSSILTPSITGSLFVLFLLPVAAELGLALWLMIMGARIEPPR